MRPPRLVIVGLLTASLALSACGSDSTTAPNDKNNPGTSSCSTKYAALVNGTAWCALSTAANYYAGQQQVVITGAGLISPTVSYAITLSVSSITAAGTYNLTSQSPLRFAVIGSSTGVGYSTSSTSGSGSITFTTFTTSHVVGTFTITAPATSGGTGTVTVTGGSFDVTLTPG